MQRLLRFLLYGRNACKHSCLLTGLNCYLSAAEEHGGPPLPCVQVVAARLARPPAAMSLLHIMMRQHGDMQQVLRQSQVVLCQLLGVATGQGLLPATPRSFADTGAGLPTQVSCLQCHLAPYICSS
jgi:hypothetical protein